MRVCYMGIKYGIIEEFGDLSKKEYAQIYGLLPHIKLVEKNIIKKK